MPTYTPVGREVPDKFVGHADLRAVSSYVLMLRS